MHSTGSDTGEPSFAADGYEVVRWPFDPATLDIFAGWAMMARLGASARLPGELDSRHADPMSRSLLLSLQPIVERHTGLALLPGDSILRVYEGGARPPRAVERPAWEVSASLTIGYDAPHGWPIWVESRGAARPCFLERGDMLIYRSRDLPHWREPFEGGFWIQATFHYLDASGGARRPRNDGGGGIGRGGAVLPAAAPAASWFGA